MGKVDISLKNFIKIDSVFAQLFSQGVFSGNVTIAPDSLEELDTVNQETVQAADGRLRNRERLRDSHKIAKVFDNKVAMQIILGVENQLGVNYYMPVRCMELDALTYVHQCRQISEKAKESKRIKKYADGVPKGTKIMPAVTLVFYCGSKSWDGPVSVYDMLDIPEEMKDWMKRTAPDYRMNLIDARHMSDEEIERFEGDLKAFLIMLRDRYDPEKLRTVVARYRETWYTVGAIKNDDRYVEYINSISDEEMAGGVNVDATLDYIEARGRVKGEAKGEARGINKVNQLVSLLLQDGRMEELERSTKDEEYQKMLFVEYGLEDAAKS